MLIFLSNSATKRSNQVKLYMHVSFRLLIHLVYQGVDETSRTIPLPLTGQLIPAGAESGSYFFLMLGGSAVLNFQNLFELKKISGDLKMNK